MKFLYFDPGTGALIVQFLVAIGAGIVLFYNRIKFKILSLFGKVKKEELFEDIDIDDKESDK
jgi:hypothetical protein